MGLGSDSAKENPQLTLAGLFRRLAPLSLSDVVMALGDPLQTMTLARLPDPQTQLAVTGIVKSVASFLESPVLMVLHASTALGRQTGSRLALARFVWGLGALLTLLFLALATPPLYRWLMLDVFGTTSRLATVGFPAFLLVVGWPGLIAWRRYYQGLLILAGQGKCLGTASMGRLLFLVAALLGGLMMRVQGALLTAVVMIGGVLTEAVLVTLFAHRTGATRLPPEEPKPATSRLPHTLARVAAFYLPLAAGVLVTYLSRTALLSLVARAEDGTLALACWPATWGFVVVVANASRMVQQIVIAHANEVSPRLLLTFAALAGGLLSLVLFTLGFSPAGDWLLGHLLGVPLLTAAMLPALRICTSLPLLIALQNAMQGYYVVAARTWPVNRAVTLGAAASLLLVSALVFATPMPGATAAAWATMGGLGLEISLLSVGLSGVLPVSRRSGPALPR